MATRALIIDDDSRLYELLREYLGDNDVRTAHASSGGVGLERLSREMFDVVLLDVMMPGMNGLQVLERIRERHRVPVIMLTAKGDETDRVVGLELGADDYIPKPFSPRELLARMRAVLRRAHPTADDEQLAVGNLAVDLATREARAGGRLLDLTALELDLLVALMRKAGRVVPRARLLVDAGREDVTVGERTVDVHISHLRRKIGDDPRRPRIIKTVRGVGYVLGRDER